MPVRNLIVASALCILGALSTGCAPGEPIPDIALAQRLAEHTPVRVPEGDGPFPAVILLHTCYGNVGHVNAWAAWLQSRGYVAAVVNSMQARGLDDPFARMAVCGGRALRAPDRARDVGITIERLRRSAPVDAERIGVVGFSHGGWTALGFLGAGMRGAAEGSANVDGSAVASVVAVYPYCGGEAMEGLGLWPRRIRVLMLLAGRDTTVGTHECRALADAQRTRGYDVDVHVYPKAEHGYDIDPALIYGYAQRYDEAAASDTRKRIFAFLERTLADGRTATSLERERLHAD